MGVIVYVCIQHSFYWSPAMSPCVISTHTPDLTLTLVHGNELVCLHFAIVRVDIHVQLIWHPSTHNSSNLHNSTNVIFVALGTVLECACFVKLFQMQTFVFILRRIKCRCCDACGQWRNTTRTDSWQDHASRVLYTVCCSFAKLSSPWWVREIRDVHWTVSWRLAKVRQE